MHSQRKWDGFLKLDILSKANIENLEKNLKEIENKKHLLALRGGLNTGLSKPLDNAEKMITDELRSAKRYEVITKRGAVAVLVYVVDTDEFVLVRQWRPSTQEYYLEVPAGTIDEDDPLETLKRELMEEIGLQVRDEHITIVGQGLQPSPGWLNEKLNLYVVKVLSHHFIGEGGGLKEEGEDIEVVRMPYNDFMDYDFKDLKTVTLKNWFLYFGSTLTPNYK